MWLKKWITGLLIVMSAALALAQDSGGLSDLLDSVVEFEIVVATTKIAQRTIEAPGVVSVISRDQIADFGWTSLNDALYKLPGFFPVQDYDRRTVGARGLFEGWNNNHLLMLIDGVPYNDNLYGTAFTSELTPLFMVKSIEVVRGPGSALYGSNATNGLVTINTLSAEDLGGKGWARTRLGDFNTQIYDAVAGSKGTHFSAVVGYNAYTTDGNEYDYYDDYINSGRPMTDGKLRTYDARRSSYLFSKLEGEGGLKGLSIQFHNQNWDYQTGHGWLWQIPDQAESMQESRQLFTVSYKKTGGKLSHEYTTRYQRHNIDWNMRLAVDDAYAYYPAGVWEYLKTDTEDLFARAQWSYAMPKDASILGGVETTVFFYNGDEEHYSNVDLTTAEPIADNLMQDLGPFLAWIKDEPVYNVGLFGQFASGKMLGKQLSATLGVRYDRQFFNFNALDAENVAEGQEYPTEDKAFEQVSPRLGLVYLVNQNLSIKALAGKAFRAPAPSELFGRNTWALASNLRKLEPEKITTFELAGDWILQRGLNWRINFYHIKFENQIAYAASDNASINLYTLTTAGVETELLVNKEDYSGFVNLAIAKRLDEKILDETITENDDELTWAPALTLNFGATYKQPKYTASLLGHYQGEAKRRESDYPADHEYSGLRKPQVDAWLTLDANATYHVTPYLSLDLALANLFDSNKNVLIKNFNYPFDYRQESRRVLLSARVKL